VRTIRYYIEEGLLPQPRYEGRYSYYTLAFLDRLELIRRLKDTYLPLSEIREIMNSLTDQEVRRRLLQSPSPSPKFSKQPPAPQAKTKPGTRALEYIDRVMDEQNIYRTKGTKEKSLPAAEHEPHPLFRTAIVQPAPTPTPAEETWQRIQLAPGVELHLRSPLDRTIEKQVQQMIYLARQIFHK